MTVRLKTMARMLVDRVPASSRAHAAYRSRQLIRAYRKRREAYHAACRTRGIVYSEAASVAAVRARIAERGYKPALREPGTVHTFAVIPRYGWHDHLYAELAGLGPVTEFDYRALGYEVYRDLGRRGAEGSRLRAAMNDRLLEAFGEAHARRPVDWVFVYAQGLEVSRRTIEAIGTRWGVPTVNMCLDDKQSWAGRRMGDHRAGQVDIASAFDLSWTSARVACEWYLAEGARPFYLPEGCNPATYRPLPTPQDIGVSFVGAAYGFRKDTVAFLRRHGVDVVVFGDGWGTRSVWGDEAVEVFCRSKINLGLGGIGYCETLTNVKTRDFEVPCTGGGLYLTSFNPDLALHFRVGEEIGCYRNRDEMLELIRYYLARPDEAASIAGRARERCLAEHRWLQRYTTMCRALGVLR